MGLLPLVLLLAGSLPREAGLNVQVSIKEKSPYVGQGVEVRVGVVATDRRPTLSAPKVPGVELAPFNQEFRPISSTGIGDRLGEQNLFVTRYRLVPGKAGPLRIGPFRAEVDGHEGVSKPATLEVLPLPPGRPPGFLGGVGRLTVKGEAVPKGIRLGQEFEFRVGLTGPGARGSVESPDLDRLAKAVGPSRLTPLPPEVAMDPPSRIFRYRVRPEKAGEFRLPPVSVAWFDPTTGRYQTATSSSVSLQVSELSRFEPPPGPRPEPEPPRSATSGVSKPADPVRRWGPVFLSGAVALLGVGIWRRSRPRLDPIPRLIRAIEEESDQGLPDRVIASLAELMEVRFERRGGELTPAEAEAAVRTRTRDDGLADAVGRLVEACDRARFSTDSRRPEGLRGEAKAWLLEVRARSARKR